MSVLPIAIVDAHHHLWDLTRGRYPWLQGSYDATRFILGEYRPLCADFLPPHFRAAWESMPVVATVHVEAECERSDALAETAWLHELAAAEHLPNAVVGYVDLLAADAADQLARHAAHPLLRAIRCKPATSRAPGESVRNTAGSLHDKRWPAALELLRHYGLAWDLRVPFWHLDEAAELVRDCPATKVVLEHTGLPWDRSDAGLAIWRRGLHALAACPNVHIKLSELGLRDRAWHVEENLPIIRTAVAVFGWQRCMFGSNFPVAGLRIGYAALIRAMAECLAHLGERERQAIWRDNAMAFYQLTAKTT